MSAMSRRGLIRSMGGAALALPFLSAMRTGAQGVVAPKRFLVMFTPNGVFKPNWFPTGSEHDWEISPCLAPLARHKDRLLVLGGQGWDPDYDATHNARDHIGVSIKCLPSLPSQGHELQSMLTGLPGAEFDGQTWANGPSIDQIIANHIGADTVFRSLEAGVRVTGNEGNGLRLNYLDAGAPIPAENDPAAMWDRVFGTLSLDPAEADRRRAQRQRVVDFLHRRFSTLRPRLGVADQRVLDAHTASLSALESRLLGSGGGMCTLPERQVVESGHWDDWSNMPALARAQMDNIAAAFACDLTRVATLQVSGAASNARYTFLNGPDGRPITELHHGLSHEPWSNADAMEKMTRISQWHSEQLAYLMDRLAETPDLDGRTVLDNTCILWMNELSHGVYHTHQNMPWLLAGGAGMRTGRFLQLGDTAHNDLLLAIAQLMDVPIDHVGSPEWTTGAMPGLT